MRCHAFTSFEDIGNKIVLNLFFRQIIKERYFIKYFLLIFGVNSEIQLIQNKELCF